MKFATFVRQSSLFSSSLQKIKLKIQTLIGNSDLESDKYKKIIRFHYEAKNKFSEFKEALATLVSSEKVDDYNEDEALLVEEDIRELYFSILDLIEPYIAKNVKTDCNNSSCSQNLTSNVNVKLPPLSLKTFNGSPEQWISFFNLFEASVDQNPNIGEAEKMQYLLTSLNGEPLSLIKNLPITSENYTIAWNILKQRYQNSRKIISYHTNNLIDLVPVSNPTARNLRSFVSSFNENDQALLALKHDVKKDNIILSSLLLRKLDSETRKRFENGRPDSQKMPDPKEIITFLENECTNMEAACLTDNVVTSHSQVKQLKSNYSKPFEKPVRTVLHSTTKPSCKYCDCPEHSIYGCYSFKELSTPNKHKFVKEKHLCLNCLGTAHSVKDCKSKRTCSQCNKKHHTWLHLTSTNLTPPSAPELTSDISRISQNSSSSSSNPPNSNNSFVAFSQSKSDRPSTILLGTTLVHVTSKQGHSLVIRAVVDTASTITCVTESTARLLSLERHSDVFNNVVGLSSCQVKTQGISNLDLSTLSGTKIATMHPVVILGKITSNLPHTQVPHDIKGKFKNLVLADPTFDVPSSVDMLLGADLFAKIMTGERLIIGNDVPAAMNSVFGYIIIGSSPSLSSTPKPIVSNPNSEEITLLTTHDLHTAVQRFWTQEEPPLKLKPTPEEEFCETHFQENYSRDNDGRYIVRLPLKENHPPLGESAETAKRRFFSLERKLNSDIDLKGKYIDCMNDYINSGDMKLVNSPILENGKHYFLPHHAVIKNDSSSTKLRVVFDASARTSTGISLNEILHCGPKLQNEIQ